MAPLRKHRRSWPWFEHRLPGVLAALPEIHAILERPGARLADVGCGGGWSSIALARAYPGASVVIMDEAVADQFAPGGDAIERSMYGFSLMIFLPDGVATKPSAATGTVMRPETLRRYAREAGFSDLEVLPTGEFGFWRVYRLTL